MPKLEIVIFFWRVKLDQSISNTSSKNQSHCRFGTEFDIFYVVVQLTAPEFFPRSARVDFIRVLLGYWLATLNILLLEDANLLIVAARGNNLTEFRVGPSYAPHCSFMFATNFVGALPLLGWV